MRNKRYSTIACLLLFAPLGHTQQPHIDSLRQVFTNEQDPVKKIDAFYEMANDRSFGNPTLAFAYADSIEAMAKEVGYQKGLAMVKHLRGFAHDYLNEPEKALEYFKEELAIFQKLNDQKEISTVYTNLGSVWGTLGSTDSSIYYYLKSLAIDEARGDSLSASIIYNNIGNIYSDEGVYERAVEYFEKALRIRENMGVERRYIQCYSNLASVYGRMLDFPKAEEYTRKGMDLSLKYDNKNMAGIIANNLGSSYNDVRRFKDAVPWLEQALASWKAIGYEAYQTYAYSNLAEAYSGLGNGQKALLAANEGFALVEKLGMDGQLELYYKTFAKVYEAKGDVASAYLYYRKYVAIADSLFKLDNTKKVAQMEAQYESQKKEAQLAKQQLEIERSNAQKQNILFGAASAVLLLIGLFYYFRNKQKIKQKEAEIAAKKADLVAQAEHAEAEKLREMDALKSIFFANISHEFRTPLTLIVSPLRQLLDNPSERPNPSLFRTMLLSGERLLELVNQLLDLTKAEAGQLKLQPIEADLLPVLRGIAGSFTSLADVRQIHFETTMPHGEITARFDKDKLAKIVANLLSNAFKFTPEEGKVMLEAGTYNLERGNGPPDNKGLLLTVRDSGIGIAETDMPFLFERFYRANSVSRAGLVGSGIGLALVKELVELHGGSIEVESPDTKFAATGTTFRVQLPIIINTSPLSVEALKVEVLSGGTAPTTFAPIAEGAPAPKPGLPQVLVVEDNPDVRHFIKGCLEKHYNIMLAHDGRHGLETAQQHIPDLIISDVMMPEMDGFELTHALKTDARTSHIPVVLLTARAEQSDKLEGLQTGADDYLVKPFDAKELLVRVDNLIAQRKKLQEHYRSTLSPFATTPVEAESMDAVFLQNVKTAVENSLDDENFSVVELGQQIGMSRSQLHRKLSALTGFSPNEVIRNMRLERAKQLLEKKAGTVSEVAYLCGFSSPAYFSKCFKDYFGRTPGEIN